MKASRLHLSLLSLGLASALCIPALRADDDKTPPSGPPPHGGGGGMHRGGPMMMFDKLDLTDDQKAKIKQIFEDTEKERRAKIDAVLTDEQKAKLAAMREAHKDGDKPGGKGGDAPTPPAKLTPDNSAN